MRECTSRDSPQKWAKPCRPSPLNLFHSVSPTMQPLTGAVNPLTKSLFESVGTIYKQNLKLPRRCRIDARNAYGKVPEGRQNWMKLGPKPQGLLTHQWNKTYLWRRRRKCFSELCLFVFFFRADFVQAVQEDFVAFGRWMLWTPTLLALLVASPMFSPVFNMAQNILKTIKYKQENKKHAWNIGSAVGIMVPFHQCYFLAVWVHQTNFRDLCGCCTCQKKTP